MAKAPRKYSIADVLGFGAAAPRSLASGLQREYRRMPRNAPIQGGIKATKPTATQELVQLLTPNTRAGNEFANKLAPAIDMSPIGVLTGLVDARRAYQAGNTGQAAGLGILAALGAIPGGKGASKAGSTMFDTVRDAGMGQVFRRTPEGAYVTVMENSKYAPRPNSVTDFVVPEELRGKGVGGKMLDEIFSIYGPETISAAASSIPSVKAFYKRGLRPGGNPNATLDDAIKIMKEDSSVTMVKPKSEGIIAYHGSPHSFDKFALDKIGTGEGAQAYGHGLYFAENENVANSYRQALAKVDRKPFEDAGLRDRDVDAAFSFAKTGHFSDPQAMAKDFANWTGKPVTPELVEAFKQAKDPGSMYQVRINANPEDFLDWDAPLSGPGAAEAMAAKFDSVDPIMRKTLEDWAYENSRRNLPMPDGQDIVSKFGGITGVNARTLSENLKNAGIPGIKYLDQGSRGAGSGSSNYVVFDDALIDILKKYGIAVPALAGGGLLATQPQQNGGI